MFFQIFKRSAENTGTLTFSCPTDARFFCQYSWAYHSCLCDQFLVSGTTWLLWQAVLSKSCGKNGTPRRHGTALYGSLVLIRPSACLCMPRRSQRWMRISCPFSRHLFLSSRCFCRPEKSSRVGNRFCTRLFLHAD